LALRRNGGGGTIRHATRCWPGRNQRLGYSDTYIIEVSSQAAGIVVRAPGGYRFFAASHRFSRLEGQIFRNAREAERAARRLAGGMSLAA